MIDDYHININVAIVVGFICHDKPSGNLESQGWLWC